MSTVERLSDVSLSSSSQAFDFLAPERRQKFDLLLHLLANLPRLLFLAGPDGIGKSTFLRQLREDGLPGWRICCVEADENLNLEGLLRLLAGALELGESAEAAVGERLASMAAADELAVLMLDEGGRLLPGVLDALGRFAARHPALRVVVALRPDDLHVKAVTDQWAVEEAHVVEIPPLTEAQTRDYVCSLLTRLGRREPDEAFTALVYRHSHGIPARVRQETLARMDKPPPVWHWALAKPVYFALTVVVVIVVGLTWWQQRVSTVPSAEVTAETPAPPAQAEDQVLAEPGQQPDFSPLPASRLPIPQSSPSPVIEAGGTSGMKETTPLRTVEVPAAVPVEMAPTAEAPERNTEKAESQVSGPASQSRNAEVSESAGSKTPLQGLALHDAAWLLEQEPLHFTLQIAAFDKLADLADFVRRHPGLEPLAYYRKQRRGRDWYSLLYGIFPSLGVAREAQKHLPADLGKPWLRRLRSVQKDIRAVRSR